MLYIKGTTITLIGYGIILPPAKEHLTGITALLQHPFATMWNLKLQMKGKLGLLSQEIAECKGFAISNGSFKDDDGAAAWIIKRSMGMNCIKSLIPRAPEDQSAFHSKLTGLYGIMLTLSYLVLEKEQLTPILVACEW